MALREIRGGVEMLTCHLDTYHWNRLAAGHLGADRFRDAVRHSRIAPVLSLIHMLEFASRVPDTTRAVVGGFIDEVMALGTVKWIHLRGSIEAAEYRNEFSRFMGWPAPSIQVFERTLTDTMPLPVDGATEASWRREPITVQLESLHTSADRLNGYLEFRRREHPSFVAKSVAEPWARALKPYEWSAFAPDGRILPRTRQMELDFQKHFCLHRCPAVRLSYAYNTQWKKNPPALQDSDLEDLNHLAAVAYCDVSFVDGRTQNLLEQGRIYPLPKRNGEFEDWLQDL